MVDYEGDEAAGSLVIRRLSTIIRHQQEEEFSLKSDSVTATSQAAEMHSFLYKYVIIESVCR